MMSGANDGGSVPLWHRRGGFGERWVEEPSAHITKKLPRELLGYLDQRFQGKRKDR